MDKEKVIEAVGEALEKRMPEFMENIQKAQDSKKKDIAEAMKKGEVATENKSIMRTFAEHGELAFSAPFLKLSKQTEKFVSELKDKALGIVKASDQNTANDEEGGYLVAPAEMDQSIIQYQWQESVLRKFATIKTTRGNEYKTNKLDQSTNSFGGVTTAWDNEGDALTQSGFKLGQLRLIVNRVTGLTVSSNELLQDSLVDVANFIVQVFGAAISYKEDMAFFQGTGDGQPQGILTYPSIQSVNRATANQVNYSDINSMFHSLKTGARTKGMWFGSATAIKYLDGLVDGNSRPLFTISENPSDNFSGRMKGRPVVELDEAYLPALGTKGDLIFVDPTKYYILDKLGMRVEVSAHYRFNYDEMTWRFVKRVDGQFVLGESGVVLDVPSA